MRLTLNIFGHTLDVSLAADDVDDGNDPGDCTSYPIGFSPSPGDQRYEQVPDLE